MESGKNLTLGQNIVSSDNFSDPKNVSAMNNMSIGGKKTVELRYKGIIPIKQVNVEYINEMMLVPCGTPFGVKMLTDGVVVVGTAEVDGENGSINPAENAGIKVGDIIVSINGEKVVDNNQVAQIIAGSGGQNLNFSIKRKDLGYDLVLIPEKSTYDGSFKGGLWVRDSSAGIGTMTYYSPDSGAFGGLGHPICDVETGEILPLMNGEVLEVDITGINKGLHGIPGELRGVFSNNGTSGELLMNSESGVFGFLNQNPSAHQPIPLGLRQEITKGDATIYCTIDADGPKEYSIYIDSVDLSGSNPTKNMVIHVTDPKLLENTGGIVQGMSGSPIIQGGKIVGAVTHVFVNDPTKGYGIFAENMIKTSSNLTIDNAS